MNRCNLKGLGLREHAWGRGGSTYPGVGLTTVTTNLKCTYCSNVCILRKFLTMFTCKLYSKWFHVCKLGTISDSVIVNWIIFWTLCLKLGNYLVLSGMALTDNSMYTPFHRVGLLRLTATEE